jgi:hypothetical protein
LIVRRFGSLASVLVLLGCGNSVAPGAGVSTPRPIVPAASSSAPSAQSELAARARAVRLTPADAATTQLPTPRLELSRPTLGEIVEEPLARRYELRLEVQGFVLTRTGQGAIVSLDGKRPRRWPSEGALKLGDLVAENEPLAAGAHVLLVALVDAQGRVLRAPEKNGHPPFFVVDFSIAIPVRLPPTSHGRVFCLSPFGTYYGDEGRAVRLELFSVGRVENPLALRIASHKLDFSAQVDPDRPYEVAGLPLGDVHVTSASGRPELHCVATLNPEIPARAK